MARTLSSRLPWLRLAVSRRQRQDLDRLARSLEANANTLAGLPTAPSESGRALGDDAVTVLAARLRRANDVVADLVRRRDHDSGADVGS